MERLGLDGYGYPRERLDVMTMARIAALQSTLGWLAPMATRPTVQHLADGGTVAFEQKQQKPKKPTKSQRVVMLTGEQFYDAWMAAVRTMREVHGERWDLRPAAWQWATLAPKHRKLTTAIVDDGQGGKRGGVTLKWGRDQKLPAARYWPAGEIPAGVVLTEAVAPVRTPWVLRNWGPDGALIEVHPMLARLNEARADQIKADRPLRVAALYRAAVDKMDHARERAAKEGPYYEPVAERRAAYRKAIAAAWALRGEVRALRAVA